MSSALAGRFFTTELPEKPTTGLSNIAFSTCQALFEKPYVYEPSKQLRDVRTTSDNRLR